MSNYSKRLSEDEFQVAIGLMGISEQTKIIARGVLVLGRKQAEFAKAFGITKGAVSLACKRVWESHLKNSQKEMVKIEALLPKNKAYIVKKWEKAALEKIGMQEKG